jgi:hypothetical protein
LPHVPIAPTSFAQLIRNAKKKARLNNGEGPEGARVS